MTTKMGADQESAFRASLKTTEQLQIWDSANNPTTALSGAFGPTGYIQRKAAYYNKLPRGWYEDSKNEWTENMETGILSGYVLPDQVDLYLQHHLRLRMVVLLHLKS